MKRLNIGLVHYSCPPVVGGVEEIIRQHSIILHRQGQSVRVLAGMGEPYTGQFPVRIEPLVGSRHKRVVEANARSAQGEHAHTYKLAEEILGVLMDWSEGLDVVLAHNVLHTHFNLALTLALWQLAERRPELKLVSWAHDSPFFRPDPPEYLFHPPWNTLRSPHPKIHYVTISETRRQLFVERVGDFGWSVIHNGIDPVEFFYLDSRTARLAEELRIFERDLVVVQPARVTPRKNQQLAIRIVHGIKSLGYDVLFILTGAYDPHEPQATAYYHQLKALVRELNLEDNFAFVAEHTFADGQRLIPDRIFIRDLYLLADLLLMTSTDEGFGLPLLEAAMAKLPIACTDIAIFREIGREEVCFIRASDPPLYSAGRIMEFLALNGSAKMFRRVMKDFIWEAICRNELLPFLDRLVRG